MGLLTIIPGDLAIHAPTQRRVEIIGYADSNFIAVPVDETDRAIGTASMTAPVTEFVATSPATLIARPAAPRAADTILSQTGEIARLQAQITDLQKKLQAAEQRADDTAARAAELLAQPSTSPRPEGEGQGVRVETKIEVRVERNINENVLSRYLNDGWRIIHTQFIVLSEDDDQLHVVLQRTVPAAPAPQPEQRAAVVTGTIVPMSKYIGDDDEYGPDDVPPLPALDPDPLMPPTEPLPALNTLVTDTSIDGAAFTRAALNARLSPDQTMKLLNDRLKAVSRAAFNAAPAPRPFVPLMGVSTK